jgi:uncharacterized protein (DUF983 family)
MDPFWFDQRCTDIVGTPGLAWCCPRCGSPQVHEAAVRMRVCGACGEIEVISFAPVAADAPPHEEKR